MSRRTQVWMSPPGSKGSIRNGLTLGISPRSSGSETKVVRPRNAHRAGDRFATPSRLIERLISEGRELATLIHPSAVVARSATSVLPGAVRGRHRRSRTTIGVGTITTAARSSVITPPSARMFSWVGANIAGGVTIGDELYIAMAAVVRDDRTVGARATVGAGAVVVGDVPADTTVVGLPLAPGSQLIGDA